MCEKIFEFIVKGFLSKLTLINSFFTSGRWLWLHLLLWLLLVGTREGIVWVVGRSLGQILLHHLLLLELVEGAPTQDHPPLFDHGSRLGRFLEEMKRATTFF